MTSTNALAITEDRPLAWTTPDGRFTVTVAATRFTFTVTVYCGTRRVDELCRTHATESEARDLARDVAKRLRDGATVAEVTAAIQPAAEVISEATTALVDAIAARKLPLPQQRALFGAVDGVIARRDVVTVKTLYSLADKHLGDLAYRGRYTVDHLVLNSHGLRLQRALADLHVLAA